MRAGRERDRGRGRDRDRDRGRTHKRIVTKPAHLPLFFLSPPGSKRIVVCYYEASNHWWVAKALRKKHFGTVLAVEWHPNSIMVATACVDRCVRIFNAFVKGVDKAEARTAAGLSPESKFGEELYKLEMGGWPRGLSFAPSGKALAIAGHDSSVRGEGDGDDDDDDADDDGNDDDIDADGVVLFFPASPRRSTS